MDEFNITDTAKCSAKMGGGKVWNEVETELRGEYTRMLRDGMPEAEAKEKIAKETKAKVDEAMKLDEQIRSRTREKQNALLETLREVKEKRGVEQGYRWLMNMLDYTAEGSAPSFTSLIGREKSGMGQAFSQLRIHEWMPNWYGGNRQDMDDFIRKLFNERTKSKDADALAVRWNQYTTNSVERYNTAMGATIIKNKDDWRLPQYHPAERLAHIGREKWVRSIREKVLDPYGEAVDDARLGRIYDRIIEASANPSKVPLAQRQRYFHFKSARDWLEYHRSIGVDDLYSVIMNHIQNMEKRIAFAEMFGNNPQGFLDTAIGILGASRSGGTATERHLRNMFASATSESNTFVVSNLLTSWNEAGGFRKALAKTWLNLPQVRNVVSKVNLKNAVFSIPSELSQHMIRSGFFNMKGVRSFTNALRTFDLGREGAREQLAAFGLFLDSTIHRVQGVSRHMGDIADQFGKIHRATNAGLELTFFSSGVDILKSSWMFGLLEHLTLQMNRHWDSLDNVLRKTLTSHGLGKADWEETMRQSAKAMTRTKWGGEKVRLLNPIMLDDELARKWQSMLLKEGDLVSGNNNLLVDSLISGGHARGTVEREIRETSLMYFRWVLSITLMNLLPLYRNIGRHKGLGQVAINASLIATILGYMNFQIRQVIHGEEVKLPTTGKTAMEHMLSAMAYGGGFGLAGDFLLTPNKFTRGLPPIVQLSNSPMWQALENVRKTGLKGGESFLEKVFDDPKARQEEIDYGKVISSISPAWQLNYLLNNHLADMIDEMTAK